MDRRPPRNFNKELADLETDLAALTLRVAHLRTQVPTENSEHSPTLGDRVRFRIVGQGNAEGVIIATTAHRIRIRQDITGHIILRAPHKVTVL
jgi:uncharacterized Fe-S cluster-containing radical SAM superfamily enzyme